MASNSHHLFALTAVLVLLASTVVESRLIVKIRAPAGEHQFWRRSPPPRGRLPPPARRSASPPPTPRSPASSPPPPSFPREGNGIRIVGDSGPKGRLEVSSVDGWLTEYEEGVVAWRPVCSVGMDDTMALNMCELLGYQYGRLYYTPEVARQPAPEEATLFSDDPIENLNCSPVTRYAPPPGEEGGVGEHHRRRQLLAPLRGTINIPDDAPYTCDFYVGGERRCDYTGPLMGIECSYTELGPAPPPPPSPPSPPNAPPPAKEALRTYGSGIGTVAGLEPNFCTTEEQSDCTQNWRAEMLVDDPDSPGNQVWAPVCAVMDNEDLSTVTAQVICEQNVNHPDDTFIMIQHTLQLPLPIPEEPEAGATDVFRPSDYKYWVTITGGEPDGRYPALQQMQYTVASSCPDGQVLAFSCGYADD